MMRKFITAACFVLGLGPLSTQADDIDTLSEIIGITDVIEIMRDEGLGYGDELRDEMLGGQGGAHWDERIDQIYDTARMRAVFDRQFEAEMAGVDQTPLINFFSSDRGHKIIQLELSARRALLDEAVEETARETLHIAEADGSDRLELIRRYSDVNDLIDANVEGALNSNLAFFRGLQEGGAFEGELTEQQILIDVWSQEPEIRMETTDWVLSYLLMAYGPLTDDDIEAYIALSETEEGQAMNRALFIAFDEMFVEISYNLGDAVAMFIAGEDI